MFFTTKNAGGTTKKARKSKVGRKFEEEMPKKIGKTVHEREWAERKSHLIKGPEWRLYTNAVELQFFFIYFLDMNSIVSL